MFYVLVFYNWEKIAFEFCNLSYNKHKISLNTLTYL